MKSSNLRSQASSPAQDEHSQSTERLIYLTEADIKLRMLESALEEQMQSSATVIEYNRRMRLLEDTGEIEPEESSHFAISQMETPRFNEQQLRVPRLNADIHTFGSVASSPTSDCERINRDWAQIFPKESEVNEVSWEDSTNKRDYIITISAYSRQLSQPPVSEITENKSSSISHSVLYSMDLDTPQLSHQNTKSPQYTPDSQVQTEPPLRLESNSFSMRVGCGGFCSFFGLFS
eukprot:CAMPEP_0204916106 /NCGR_PEP_ID=MMETSP1397-20131031/14001_1 /ASSEMBLY_ACC=CAM_ASM_000891 /TAXON_ID=49980 /ORGANISM="Climacostomum Climacostomum virens, Strain Stock W-24" /LENGTH=233 /DNA_ID=CAMNT_0052088483 /DNA_START=53 /DNA_END=754 /DNA_ORIENTATION=-